MKERYDRFLVALSSMQRRYAGWFLGLSLLFVAASVPLIQQLGLNSAWTALLPDDKLSVRDLERVKDRVGGLASLTVAVQSKDLPAMQRFARDLVPRLETLRGEVVRSIDWTVSDYEQFIRDNRFLFAEKDELQDVRDALDEKLKKETGKLNPFFVDLEEDEDPLDRAIERLESKAKRSEKKLARYPDGFYVHEDRDLLFMFVRTDLQGGDSKGTEWLIRSIQKEIDALQPQRYAKDMRVDFAGDIIVAREEHEAIASELVIATTLAVVGVLLAIYLFFRRLRALAVLGYALLVPVAVTFACAEWLVDYLNTSTAFLASIVIGNGINPSIIWLARYYEERRKGRNIRAAILATHRGATLATMTASMAAAVAYGSLVLTEFRGFRDFGIIGGIGMVLCWLSSLLLLPCLAALAERLPGFHKVRHPETKSLYGVWFWKFVNWSPRGVLVGSAMFSLIATGFVAWAVYEDPIEYDFRRMRSVREESTKAQKIQHRYGETVDSQRQGNGIAMLVPKRSDTAPLQRELERRRDEEGKRYGAVRSIEDLIPDDQPEKLVLLAEIRRLMLKLREHASPSEIARIDKHLPPENLQRIGDADLPERVARPFTEKDGTRGRLLVVEEVSEGASIWDGRYLMEWSKALRDVRLEDGSRPPLAGRAPVFADMVEVIVQDGPKAIVLSICATMLLVMLAFRRTRERMLTLIALVLGLLWMAGSMALLNMKLNFLNFVAFPITCGNGVDYGVNVMRRFIQDRNLGQEGAIRSAVEETGGAVVLCSLTTIIGYGSLYASANLALNSFGAAMAISEVTCVVSAIITLPAYVLWRARKKTCGAVDVPQDSAQGGAARRGAQRGDVGEGRAQRAVGAR